MADASEQQARRLLLMTLALEEAVVREAWPETDSLFAQRERLIGQLEKTPLSAAAIRVIGEVKRVDDRIAAILTSGKAAVQSELQSGTRGRKAAKAYSQNTAISSLDKAS